MLNWHTPRLSDAALVKDCVSKSGYNGSDAAFANIFLLRNKYDIKIAFANGCLLRHLNGSGTRCGYTFPLGKTEDVYGALDILLRENPGAKLCLADDAQKETLSSLLNGTWETDPGDCDYLFDTFSLANYPGSKYVKKRNAVSKFLRTYQTVKTEALERNNAGDALYIARGWMAEEHPSASIKELEAIEEALEKLNELDLHGCICYANGAPAAMAIYSHINSDYADIHFEKCLREPAQNGGYAFITRETARRITAGHINFEEDINLQGLRQAKRLYRPEKLLVKHHLVRLSEECK